MRLNDKYKFLLLCNTFICDDDSNNNVKQREKMHNNKPIKNHDQGFIYVRKKDLDNAITYGLFNNINEKEEYTIDKPRPNPDDYYIIEVKGTEKIESEK